VAQVFAVNGKENMYRLEYVHEGTNSFKFFEMNMRIALSLDEKAEDWEVTIRHSCLEQERHVKPTIWREGTREFVQSEVDRMILLKKGHKYVPVSDEAKKRAISLGWTGWRDK